MGALAQLEVLSIEENALTALPERIGGLGRLHTLTAHSNQLTALPPSFGQLRNMQTLDLKKNRLETTAGALAELCALRYLDLRNNRLMVFPLLPASTALDQVFLGYNLLPSVDEDSVLRIKDSVTVFEIRDNKLAALPAKLPYLYRLKTLDVANNDLSDLPPGLGYLKHLHHLVVDGNPLRTIRWSIVSAGTQALKKYLRSRGPPPVGVDVMEEEMDEFALPQQGYEAPTQSSDGSVGSPHTIKMFREAASSGTLDMTSYGLRSVPVELDTSSNNNSWNFAATLLHLNLSKNGLEALPNEIGGLLALKASEGRMASVWVVCSD
jgi:Leucine-rich repeat (LRR) protein